MAMAPSTATGPAGLVARTSYVDWPAVIAGAISASAISFVLLAFGAAIGLSLTSPWPHAWGLGASGLAILAAIWVLLSQVGSFAAGGYLGGRLRARFTDAAASEVEFRDGAHGFLVWALGALLGAWLLGTTLGAATRTGAHAAAAIGAGAASHPDAASNAADFLFRGQRAGPAPDANASAALERNRAEAARIVAYSITGGELAQRDRTYLAQLVAARTGLAQPEAERRVDEAITEARATVDRARKSAVLASFLTAASLLISAAAACAAANLGGKHRDQGGTLRLFGRERFW